MAAFENQDPLERLAAVKAGRQRKIDSPEEFIARLSDPQPEVRQEARHALVQISGGKDFGPSEGAPLATAQEAAVQWQKWLRWHRLVVEYVLKKPEEVISLLASNEPFERWAAVTVARRLGLPVQDRLIPLLRDGSGDVQQEARQALVEAAEGEYDFGPAAGPDPAAIDESVAKWTKWQGFDQLLPACLAMDAGELAAKFDSPEALERWASVAAARRRRLPLQDEAILLLRDPDNEVRQEAHQTIVDWSDGQDYGPAGNATPAEVEAAVQNWQEWWTRKKDHREKLAANRIELARNVFKRNGLAGQKRLQSVIDDYPETDAAEEARELLVAAATPVADEPAPDDALPRPASPLPDSPRSPAAAANDDRVSQNRRHRRSTRRRKLNWRPPRSGCASPARSR